MSQRFSKLKVEENGGKRNRQEIRYRLRHVDGRGLIFPKNLRHYIDQRDQQNKLPHNSHRDRGLGISQCRKSHLTGHLNPKQEEAGCIDPQGALGKG